MLHETKYLKLEGPLIHLTHVYCLSCVKPIVGAREIAMNRTEKQSLPCGVYSCCVSGGAKSCGEQQKRGGWRGRTEGGQGRPGGEGGA